MLKEYIEKDAKLNKKQFICLLLIVDVLAGITGWLYEYIFYYFNSGMKTFYMRGRNYLPWINIYMYGSFLILFLTYRRRKHPLQVFLISALSTGILEFFSGYILYDKLGWTRCWSYNEEILNFGNIGGFVCLRSVTVFGLFGLLLIYGALPILIKIIQSKHQKLVFTLSMILFSIFMIDEIYNLLLYPYFPIPSAEEYYQSKGIQYIYFDH
ncbi:MAG: putative ABC transporter permease [Bacilli bacterium]|nr:putative ABC transporter permease [Bacilli bacterium]